VNIHGRAGRDQADRDPEHTRAPLEETAKVIVEPFRDFVRAQTSSGWTLLAATLLAVFVANSPLGGWYADLRATSLAVSVDDYSLRFSLTHWVNDGLMALFFFVLGLEFKRELLGGQLRAPRRATSVLCAALGGMLVPALVYAVIAAPEQRIGWAIPMATDTAFALMVLSLLRDRVPPAARSFLVGLAIVDDLGAICVIALGYTGTLDLSLLLPTLACIGALVVLNLAGVRHGAVYGLAGIALWVLFLGIGLHGTLAGVVVAMTAPVRPAIPRRAFAEIVHKRLRSFEAYGTRQRAPLIETPAQERITRDLSHVATAATVPLSRWESRLDNPVSFLVVPVFAFLNAGVVLSGDALLTAAENPLSYAIAIGLLVGKPLGIVGGFAIGRSLGIAMLPSGLGAHQLAGLGLLGGIGFTMSLFIATLSFGAGSDLLETTKQSIILASLLAGAAGYLYLRYSRQPET